MADSRVQVLTNQDAIAEPSRLTVRWPKIKAAFIPYVAIFIVAALPLVTFGAEYRSGDKVSIQGSFEDVIFAAGSEIEAEFQSKDDAFLAAGDVLFSAQLQENAFIAGGDVDVKNGRARAAVIAGGDISIVDSIMQDLILAGGNVRIEGTQIADDVVLAGGEIRMDRRTRVGGSMTLAGGKMSLAGTYSGDVMVAGGDVVLSGTFEKNVEVHAEELEIGPSAVIKGNLTHTSREMVLAPGAVIEGETIHVPYEEKQSKSGGWVKFGWFLFLLFLVATLLVTPVLAILFPSVAIRGGNEIGAQFWATFGKGVVVLTLLPIIFVFAFVTIIGIPFAFMMIPFGMVAAALARMVGAFTLGQKFRVWARKSTGANQASLGAGARFGWTFLAEIALVLLFFVPIVGFLLWIFVSALGFGALYATARESLRKTY